MVGIGVSGNVDFLQHFAKRLLESHLLWQSLDTAEDRFIFEKTNTKGNQFFHEQESLKQNACMCVKQVGFQNWVSVGSGHVDAKAVMKDETRETYI